MNRSASFLPEELRPQPRGRRSWRPVLALAAAMLIGLGTATLPGTFVIEEVVAADALSAQARDAVGMQHLVGLDLAAVDLGALCDRLSWLPWVDFAQVDLEPPARLIVRVYERQPVARRQVGHSQRRVDIDGQIGRLVGEEHRPELIDFELGAPLGPTLAATARVTEGIDLQTLSVRRLLPNVIGVELGDGAATELELRIALESTAGELAWQRAIAAGRLSASGFADLSHGDRLVYRAAADHEVETESAANDLEVLG